MDGMDAMLSTVQMPAGMPVATVALGKAGAINAAYLAMQILAISDKDLAVKLKEDRMVKAKAVESDSRDIEVILYRNQLHYLQFQIANGAKEVLST